MLKRARQITLALTFVLFSWLMMQIVHELGHVCAALATGTEIIQVRLYPMIISETEVWNSPHPLIEVWAGPLTGALLPLLAFLFARILRSPGLYFFRFFSGFCLIVNGIYIAFGPSGNGADTAVMLEHGTPRWLMVVFGLPAAALGLYLWNGQGRHFGLGDAAGKVDRRATIVSVLLFLAVTSAELIAGCR